MSRDEVTDESLFFYPCCISLPLPSIHKVDIISLQWLQSIICSLSSGFLILTLSENPFPIPFLLCPVSRLSFSTAGIKNGGTASEEALLQCAECQFRGEEQTGYLCQLAQSSLLFGWGHTEGSELGKETQASWLYSLRCGTSCLLVSAATLALRCVGLRLVVLVCRIYTAAQLLLITTLKSLMQSLQACEKKKKHVSFSRVTTHTELREQRRNNQNNSMLHAASHPRLLEARREDESRCVRVCVCGGGADKRAVEHLDAGDSSAHTRYEPN